MRKEASLKQWQELYEVYYIQVKTIYKTCLFSALHLLLEPPINKLLSNLKARHKDEKNPTLCIYRFNLYGV